jgi:hypothetical protein
MFRKHKGSGEQMFTKHNRKYNRVKSRVDKSSKAQQTANVLSTNRRKHPANSWLLELLPAVEQKKGVRDWTETVGSYFNKCMSNKILSSLSVRF